MQRLLRLVASQPQLVVDHAAAYADLVTVEVGRASADWTRRLVLNALGLCGLGVAMVLTGVAVMLWAALPPDGMRAPWVLIVMPLLPLAGAMGCLGLARGQDRSAPFDTLRQQVQADLALLREANA